jgi:transposase-like protein
MRWATGRVRGHRAALAAGAGLTAPPLLAVGDGALGLSAALHEIFTGRRNQRRRSHRPLEVLETLPRRLEADACQTLHAMYKAADCQLCPQHRVATAPHPALRDRRMQPTA